MKARRRKQLTQGMYDTWLPNFKYKWIINTLFYRFEDFAGETNERIHIQNYGFLGDMREKEIQDLQKVIRRTKNKEKQEEVKQELYV